MEAEEDADGRSQQQSLSNLLYCHEEPLVVSTPPPPPDAAASARRQVEVSTSSVVAGDEKEEAELLREYMARQRSYAPSSSTGYLHHLLLLQSSHSSSHGGGGAAGVSGARSRGVHYIIYAFGRLGLAAATACNAVNYLDRFLSINCHLRWEIWMTELVTVACLSIACKLDEVNIPSLHHLQMEEAMSHSFLPATIRDMELTLLKALQWRLACVTPFSFLQLLLRPLLITHSTAAASSLASAATRLLIRSLIEPWSLRFDASVIACSALRCVVAPEQADIMSCHVSRLISPESPSSLDQETDDECFKMMKALYANLDDLDIHHHQMHSEQQQQSPVSVIPFFQSADRGTISRSSVSRRLFVGESTPHRGSTQDQDI